VRVKGHDGFEGEKRLCEIPVLSGLIRKFERLGEANRD
jgi:hypothetical protein